MKCVGAEDGQRQCQRCRRANVEQVEFFMHIGRLSLLLPGVSLRNIAVGENQVQSASFRLFLWSALCLCYAARLSEASKMLRRLEKGLNSAKMKSQPTEGSPFQADEHHT